MSEAEEVGTWEAESRWQWGFPRRDWDIVSVKKVNSRQKGNTKVPIRPKSPHSLVLVKLRKSPDGERYPNKNEGGPTLEPLSRREH